MSIYLNKDSQVIVQGITGGEGTKHTALMLKAGTQVVGGVNARKAGTTVAHKDKGGNDIDLPVFASVAEAMEMTGADGDAAAAYGIQHLASKVDGLGGIVLLDRNGRPSVAYNTPRMARAYRTSEMKSDVIEV